MASSDVAFRSERDALLILGGGVSGWSMISSNLAILLSAQTVSVVSGLRERSVNQRGRSVENKLTVNCWIFT